MTDILKTLLSNSWALAVFLVAVSLLTLAVVAIFLIAFFQGRSLSFWPPKIGPRPQKTVDEVSAPPAAAETIRGENYGTAPSISTGTQIVTSSGKSVLVESRSYLGVRATLMKARDSSQKTVMVKLFWRGLIPDSSAWTEFSREYKATETLYHRNIVQTFDRGLWNGYPFLVLEFFAGGTLFDLLRARDRIPGSEIISIAEQVASGIDYAHSQGRVHRDISPSNILLESDALGRVAISDFGIAKILGALETAITASTPVFEGTPAYVAPEVFSANQASFMMDIYSFGVVLFEMIAGQSPFPTVETLPDLYRMKLQQPVPRLSAFRPVPEDLERRLLVTMDPSPDRRPQSARAVLSGMESLLLKL